MNQKSFIFLFGMLLVALTSLNAQIYSFSTAKSSTGIQLQSEIESGLTVAFSIDQFELADLTIKEETSKQILIDGSFLPNDAGAPDLPGYSRFVALPEGSAASLNVVNYKTQTISNVFLAPAPKIPLDTEDGPLVYMKNTDIYTTNEYYPLHPFQLSEKSEIRGVDVVILGITPFQYNPVTKELLVYYDVEIEIVFEGGTGNFGEDRLRSRWWDQILGEMIINCESLPEIDFHQERRFPSDSPDYEYVIITPDIPVFLSWADSIKQFRNQQGINTGVVTTSEIGGNNVTAIENYVDNAYNSWTVAPSAVLLLGDYNTGTGGITSQLYSHPGGYSDFASDNRFADVTGNDLPDIVFARITANDATQLETMITKFLDYERNPTVSSGFYDHPITALGWQTERWFQICSETIGGYLKNVQGKNPIRINAIYDGNPSSDPWSTAPNTSAVLNYFGPDGLNYIPATPGELGGFSGGTASHVINAINSGSFMLQHRDHGYYGGWGEPNFNTSSINLLNNINNQLPFIFSINCQTGAFHRSTESFAEKFHRYTYNGHNSGALGIIAATEVSYSFVNDVYVWGLFDNMFSDFLPGYASQFPVNYAMPAFGNAAGKHFLYQSGWPYNSGSKQITYRLFHHHGDAFMTLYTEVPQTLSVLHNPVIYSGETTFTVSANQGSLIALTVNGEIIGTADGTGYPVAIPIDPQTSPEEILVTVTRQNFFRYESVVEVIPPSGSYVVFESYEINDYSDNNGNGQVDYGETIWLTMTVKNMGTETATNISANISTSDTYINITTSEALFGDIPAGGVAMVIDAYIFEVENSIPDQHNINFELVANDNSKNNWQSFFSITANAPKLEFTHYSVDDSGGNNNGILDPGETAPIQISIKNNGHAAAFNAEGALMTTDPYLTIETTGLQPLGNLNPQQSGSATYIITADDGIPGGHVSETIMDIGADYGISFQPVIGFSFADYCHPTANCSYGDGFTGFALESISNLNSGCSPDGYGDFLGMSATLDPGQTYTVQWKTGYSNQDACLWIDLNNNREFEAQERLITDFNMASANTLYSTDFTVPEDAWPGNKRMRIRANWQNSSSDPCVNFSYGETEDYTVIIATADPPVADFTADNTLIFEGEIINFTDLSTNNPTGWLWDFQGGTPTGSTLQNPSVVFATVGSYSVKLTASNDAGSDSETKFHYITVVAMPECAGLVSPENGATEISVSPALQWNSGVHATGYKIYFGTDFPPTNIQNGIDLGETLEYIPDILEYESDYYWQVVAYNAYGEAENCPVWSFSTMDEPLPEGHFVPVWSSPFNPMSVIITGALWDDSELQPGDEIGLFDIDPGTGNEICVGFGILTEVLGAGNFLEIVASMDDGSNPDMAIGFTPGNEIIYKYWNNVAGEKEEILANYPYPEYDEVYTAQGTAFAELFTTVFLSQSIPLSAGWNLISFRVEPENMDMMNIVQPLIDLDLFYKIIDENGGSVIHLPFPPPNGQWSNTIGDMACTEGYYLKVTEDCELTTGGIAATLPMQIDLMEGWNIISYPCAGTTDAMNVVQPLIDANALYKVVDENGGTIFHLPFPPPNGQWSNTIGNFQPGEGYYVKVTENITLAIDEPAEGSGFKGNLVFEPTTYFQPVWQNNPYLPMHIVIDDGNLLNEGDELAVFDGDVCVGAAVYQGNPVIITCAADDPETEVVEGFTPGYSYQILAWDHINKTIYNNFEAHYISGDPDFNPLGTGIAGLEDITTGIVSGEDDEVLVHIYPNPANEKSIIDIVVPSEGNLTLEIFDVPGNLQIVINDASVFNGRHTFAIPTKELTPGNYLLKYSLEKHDRAISGYYKFIVIH